MQKIEVWYTLGEPASIYFLYMKILIRGESNRKLRLANV